MPKHIKPYPRMAALLTAAVLTCSAPFPAYSAEADTPLPVVGIETSGTIGDDYQDAVITVTDENGTADIADTACSVRLRGNSSRRSPKPSYKLHFPEKANLLQLGDGKAKTWALIGNCYDASLLRNFTAMQIAEMLSGLPYTPNCRSVELRNNGRYSGVYLLIETVSINKHRIAITEAPDEIEENGYLLEMTCYAQSPLFYADCIPFEIKSALSEDTETAQAQTDYISSYTKEALHALRSGDAERAAQYIDINSLVDNCLLNEICKNVDVGWDSYYLWKDAGGKLTFCPVWDFDIAFGNASIPSCFLAAEGENPFMLSDCVSDSNSWLCYALRQPWFRAMLKERWDALLPALRTVPEAVTAEAAAHSDAYENNYAQLKNTIAPFLPYHDDSTKPCYTQAAQAEILADWIGRRLDWLDAFYHSPEFDAGIFPDENGNELPMKNELAAYIFSKTDGESTDLDNLQYTGLASEEGRSIVRFDGLQLVGGQPYLLSFECSCTGSAQMRLEITGKDGFAPITVSETANSDTKVIEMPFTPNQDDMWSSLCILGVGSGTAEISKLSLTKQDAAAVPGDLSADGVCDGTDVRLLRDFLLCTPDVKIPNPQAGDLNADGLLNAVDLTALKRLLLTA